MSGRIIKKVLITGGCGFIGSHLVKYLSKKTDWDIIILDNLSYAGDVKNCGDARFTLIQDDITYLISIEDLKRLDIDVIFHLAAETHVDNSIETPAVFIDTNVRGTMNILELGRHYHSKNSSFIFYHMSTDEVFGSLNIDNGIYYEDNYFHSESRYNPSSPYSASKAASDHLVRAYHTTYKLPVIVTNCSNNYGTNQHQEKLIPSVIKSLYERKPINVYGNGLNERDWLHVSDHVRAVYKIVTTAEPGSTYLIGTGKSTKNIKIVKTICKVYDYIYMVHLILNL